MGRGKSKLKGNKSSGRNSNEKHQGFTLTYPDGEVKNFKVVNGKVEEVGDIYRSKSLTDIYGLADKNEIVQKAYDTYGGTEGLIKKLGSSKAKILSDVDVEKIEAEEKKKYKKGLEDRSKRESRRKKVGNRKSAYWSAM